MGVFKRGDTWYIRFHYQGRRYREAVGPNKKQAEAALASRKLEVRENRFFPEKRRQIQKTFEEMARLYLESYSKGKKRSYSRDVTSYGAMLPTFKGKLLSEITPLMVEKYMARRQEEVKPSTVNREKDFLSHLFTKAIEWGLADENPCRKVKRFKEDNRRLRYLGVEEMEALIEASKPHLRPVVITGLNTGMRIGEVLALKWEHVDFRARQICVLDSKNGDKRYIPMTETLEATLRGMPRLLHSPYVFCYPNGERYEYSKIRKPFEEACERAGIEDLTPHDMRHTYASQLAMAGVDLGTIKELLGHKSLEMTMRYSHLSPSHKRAAVEIFEAHLRGRSPKNGHREAALGDAPS